MVNKRIEALQQKELIKKYKSEWSPKHPTLKVTMINNDGNKNIVSAMEDQRMGLEAGHPDVLWRYYNNTDNQWYFLYHELKKLKGVLNKAQKEWWADFESTEYVHGAITKGLQAHFDAVENWLNFINKK